MTATVLWRRIVLPGDFAAPAPTIALQRRWETVHEPFVYLLLVGVEIQFEPKELILKEGGGQVVEPIAAEPGVFGPEITASRWPTPASLTLGGRRSFR